MAAVTHQWGVRPIVTLVSEYWESDVQWHAQPDQETFDGGIHNILKIQVEFKYKKPYGGSARYIVAFDELVGSHWVYNRLYDQVGFYRDPRDNAWHTRHREYDLYKSGLFMPWRTQTQTLTLHFRLTVWIQEPGHMDTGSSGSSGNYSEPESREFTAIFKAPGIQLLTAHISSLERDLRAYRRRLPIL